MLHKTLLSTRIKEDTSVAIVKKKRTRDHIQILLRIFNHQVSSPTSSLILLVPYLGTPVLVMSFLTTPKTCHILQEVITCTLKPSSTILLHISSINLTLSWSYSICPDSFLPPILLLAMIVVLVAVIVVVGVIAVVGVIVVGVSLVVFLSPFIAFTNSCSPTLN
ncbi:hypothetical protein Tco_1509029 [Tanacetum coccineum]